MNNKKAQYGPQDTMHTVSSFNGVSPILLIGVAVFILPFVLPIFKINLSGFFETAMYGGGLIMIIIGGILSAIGKGESR